MLAAARDEKWRPTIRPGTAARMLSSTSYFYERGTRGTADVVSFVPVHYSLSVIG